MSLKYQFNDDPLLEELSDDDQAIARTPARPPHNVFLESVREEREEMLLSEEEARLQLYFNPFQKPILCFARELNDFLYIKFDERAHLLANNLLVFVKRFVDKSRADAFEGYGEYETKMRWISRHYQEGEIPCVSLVIADALSIMHHVDMFEEVQNRAFAMTLECYPLGPGFQKRWPYYGANPALLHHFGYSPHNMILAVQGLHERILHYIVGNNQYTFLYERPPLSWLLVDDDSQSLYSSFLSKEQQLVVDNLFVWLVRVAYLLQHYHEQGTPVLKPTTDQRHVDVVERVRMEPTHERQGYMFQLQAKYRTGDESLVQMLKDSISLQKITDFFSSKELQKQLCFLAWEDTKKEQSQVQLQVQFQANMYLLSRSKRLWHQAAHIITALESKREKAPSPPRAYHRPIVRDASPGRMVVVEEPPPPSHHNHHGDSSRRSASEQSHREKGASPPSHHNHDGDSSRRSASEQSHRGRGPSQPSHHNHHGDSSRRSASEQSHRGRGPSPPHHHGDPSRRSASEQSHRGRGPSPPHHHGDPSIRSASEQSHRERELPQHHHHHGSNGQSTDARTTSQDAIHESSEHPNKRTRGSNDHDNENPKLKKQAARQSTTEAPKRKKPRSRDDNDDGKEAPKKHKTEEEEKAVEERGAARKNPQDKRKKYILNRADIRFERDKYVADTVTQAAKYLDDYGVVILPDMLSGENCKRIALSIFRDLGDHMDGFDFRHKDTWGYLLKNLHDGRLFQHYGLNWLPGVQKVREQPRIAKRFAALYSQIDKKKYEFDKDMLVSSDSFYLYLNPYSSGSGYSNASETIPFVSNQTFEDPHTELQGFVNLLGCRKLHECPGFLFLEGSHNVQQDFIEEYFPEKTGGNQTIWEIKNQEQLEYFIQENECNPVCIAAQRGDLILWNSRLMHNKNYVPIKPSASSGKHGERDFFQRLVVYVSFQPFSKAKKKDIKAKNEAFDNLKNTNYVAASGVTIVGNRKLLRAGDMRPVQHKPPISALGRKLLGLLPPPP